MDSSASGHTCHCAASRFSGNTSSSTGLSSSASALGGSLNGGFASSASAVTDNLTSLARSVSALAVSQVGLGSSVSMYSAIGHTGGFSNFIGLTGNFSGSII